VQGPIAETDFGIRLPADPFRAVVIAVFAAAGFGSAGAPGQLVGGSRCVYAGESPYFRVVRVRPPLVAAAALLGTSIVVAVAPCLLLLLLVFAAAHAPALSVSGLVVGGFRLVGSRPRPAAPIIISLR